MGNKTIKSKSQKSSTVNTQPNTEQIHLVEKLHQVSIRPVIVGAVTIVMQRFLSMCIFLFATPENYNNLTAQTFYALINLCVPMVGLIVAIFFALQQRKLRCQLNLPNTFDKYRIFSIAGIILCIYCLMRYFYFF